MLGAQTNSAQLQTALQLERQGQIDQAIAIAKPLTDSGQLRGADLGRACILLGTSYKEKGNLAESQRSFERALRIFEGDSDHLSEYASALQNYGMLYNDVGQADVAEVMWTKALRLRRQIGDHAAITRSLVALAGLALSKNHVSLANDELRAASNEMKQTTALKGDGLVDDDFALIAEAQGWLAMAQKRTHDAIAGYRRALEITRRTRGDDHWLTGWDRMLLGKALAQSGDMKQGLAETRAGYEILDRSFVRQSPKHVAAQVAYAQLLDRAGAHAQAAQLKAEADQAMKDLSRVQCVSCTINVSGFSGNADAHYF